MYYLYSLLAAVLIAVMVVANGQLSDVYNSYMASVIIHAIGLVAVSVGVIVKKTKLFNHKNIPLLVYSGGAIGVATTLFNNLAFGKISVTAIIALSLLAQTITSLVIDQFGLFGMPVKKLNLPKVAGVIFTTVGIIYLLKGSEFHLTAIILSLLTGVSIVLSRFVNAQLAERTDVYVSTWYNFSVGLLLSFLIWLCVYFLGEAGPVSFELAGNPWIYTGGLIGVCAVALSSICAKRISALILTLIMFVGQLFMGVFLDYLLVDAISSQIITGGILTTVGLAISLIPKKSKS